MYKAISQVHVSCLLAVYSVSYRSMKNPMDGQSVEYDGYEILPWC